MRRFRKPVGVKAPREFESPPLRFREIIAGFTTNRRACQRRGGASLGKTAMIFNGFPRFFEFDFECVFLDDPPPPLRAPRASSQPGHREGRVVRAPSRSAA